MDKRYQIFISSTFEDLQEARSAILQSILKQQQIPAGMELFPTTNEEQMRYIRRVIDESDYYLLIIGGRYGSLSAQGLSYTEEEYDYAVQQGVPIMAFLHERPEDLPAKHTEQNPGLKTKLKAFREKVRTGGRIIRTWRETKDLRFEFSESLSQFIKANPRTGWVRADKVASETITAEQNALLKERDSLKTEVEKLKAGLGHSATIPDIAGFDDTIPEPVYRTNLKIQQVFDKPTWRDLFLSIAIGGNMLRDIMESDLIRQRCGFDESAWQTICVQFEALGLIDISYNEYWSLTDKGKRIVREDLIVRKAAPGNEISA